MNFLTVIKLSFDFVLMFKYLQIKKKINLYILCSFCCCCIEQINILPTVREIMPIKKNITKHIILESNAEYIKGLFSLYQLCYM